MHIDSHHHEPESTKKPEEVDFFAGCEDNEDNNGFVAHESNHKNNNEVFNASHPINNLENCKVSKSLLLFCTLCTL